MSYTSTGDFYPIQKSRHGSSSPLISAVAVSLNYSDSKAKRAGKQPAVHVRLSGGILAELQWEPLQFVQVHEGTGANAGKLLLVQAKEPADGYKLSYSSQSYEAYRNRGNGDLPSCSCKFGIGGLRWHAVVQEKYVRAEAVQFNVYRGELLIAMPTWFKATEQNIETLRRTRIIEHQDDRAVSRPTPAQQEQKRGKKHTTTIRKSF